MTPKKGKFIDLYKIDDIQQPYYYQMEELRQRLAKDVSFRKQIEELELRHQIILQRSLYSDLSSIKPSLLIDAGRTLSGDQILFFFGSEMLQITNSNVEKMLMYVVKWMQHIDKNLKNFVMVYFHTSSSSYNCYLTFRKILRSLPMKYYEKMKHIILMNPSFTVRAMQWFISGTINKYLNSITQFAHSFADLRKFNIVISLKDEIYFPKIVWKQLMVGIQTNKQNQRKKSSNHTNTPEQKNNKPISTKIRKIDLEDYEANQIGVPLVLEFMIAYFILKPQRMKQQGLFRKSVSVDDINEAIKQLDKANYEFLNYVTNSHLVANLIKKFLSDLNNPIMTYQAYEHLTHDNGKSNQVSYLRSIMQKLPLKNYVTIVFVLNFFIDEIIPLSAYNKMSYYNAAVVLAPCLMRSSKNAIQDLIFSKKIVIILQFILEHFEEVFGNQQQKQELFRRSIKIQQDNFFRQSLEGTGTLNQNFNHKQPLIQPPKLPSIPIENFRFSEVEDQFPLIKKQTTHKVGVENKIFPFQN